jgi:ferredoxin
VSLEISEDDYILDALLQAGYSSPYRCRIGFDLACAAKLIEGEVDMSAARRYYDEDYEAGFILICTAKPRSDLMIKTHANREMVEHRDKHGLPAPKGGV